jgi:hypothetical protein
VSAPFGTPWKRGVFREIFNAEGESVAFCEDLRSDMTGHAPRDHADRIVACVNFCEGVSTEMILKAPGNLASLSRAANRLYAERDELLAIVRDFEAIQWDGDPRRRADDPICMRARAAIARASA